MARKWVLRVVWGIVGVLIGVIVGMLLPPVVLDDPFWRAFWSGPPVAGIFAVIGAAIAYTAAYVAARTSRIGAEREEWWDRAEWALNLARADGRGDRLVGLRALEGLKDQATQSELAMILAVTEAVQGDTSNVDNDSDQADNYWRRWLEWLRKSE